MKKKRISLLVLAAALACSCQQKMAKDGKILPYGPDAFFPGGTTALQPVPGTVARGHLDEDEAVYRGTAEGKPVERIPVPIDSALLRRGRERFNIYCAPCHGITGYGDGMIVQRGFLGPPTYHQDRLRNAPPGHFFDVITHGFGAMYAYADRVEPRDRWAIIAYIRALQLSQYAPLAQLSAEDRQRLEEGSR